MRKYSDDEIKAFFNILKALMFWPHPTEYDQYAPIFHFNRIETPEEFKCLSDVELFGLAKTLNNFIKNSPLSVYIETTNVCNLQCIMCPNKNSKRKKGKMSHELFCKIIDEIAEKQPSITVSPFYFGEPLMDEHIFKRIEYCKSKGLSYIKLSTNGSLLSENENYKRLIDSGIDYIIISFDGITKETYESIRVKSCFDKFLDGIEKLANYNHCSGSKVHIVGQMINMENNSHEKQLFGNFVTN